MNTKPNQTLVKEVIAKIVDPSFKEYLSDNIEATTQFVEHFVQFMQSEEIYPTSDTLYMKTWKQLSKDYCEHAKLDWVELIGSDGFIGSGAAVGSYLVENLK